MFSSAGCKGFNGQCMKPGDKLEVDCVNYVCDGQAKSMAPVEKGTVASQLRDSIHAKIYFIYFELPCGYFPNSLLILTVIHVTLIILLLINRC